MNKIEIEKYHYSTTYFKEQDLFSHFDSYTEKKKGNG